MTTTPDSWHEMSEPMTAFPVLVQFQNGKCEIYHGPFNISLTSAVRWRPWVNPELPKPDAAFEKWAQWYHGRTDIWMNGREVWHAATAAERSRFAEGVEKLAEQWEITLTGAVLSDLRALAKGTS